MDETKSRQWRFAPTTDGVTLKVGARYMLCSIGQYGPYLPQEFKLAQVSAKGYKFVSLETGRSLPHKSVLYPTKKACYRRHTYTLLPRGVPKDKGIMINLPLLLSERLQGVFEIEET